MKIIFRLFGVSSLVLAALFAIYYYDLDMKLMRAVVLPYLTKLYDGQSI